MCPRAPSIPAMTRKILFEMLWVILSYPPGRQLLIENMIADHKTDCESIAITSIFNQLTVTCPSSFWAKFVIIWGEPMKQTTLTAILYSRSWSRVRSYRTVGRTTSVISSWFTTTVSQIKVFSAWTVEGLSWYESCSPDITVAPVLRSDCVVILSTPTGAGIRCEK